TAMTVTGFLQPRSAGSLRIVSGPDVELRLRVDGIAVASTDARTGVTLSTGIHSIAMDATLSGERWELVPLWNGADLLSGSTSTLAMSTKPSALDAAIRPVGRWIAEALAGG